jgi:hypothetical protein
MATSVLTATKPATTTSNTVATTRSINLATTATTATTTASTRSTAPSATFAPSALDATTTTALLTAADTISDAALVGAGVDLWIIVGPVIAVLAVGIALAIFCILARRGRQQQAADNGAELKTPPSSSDLRDVYGDVSDVRAPTANAYGSVIVATQTHNYDMPNSTLAF